MKADAATVVAVKEMAKKMSDAYAAQDMSALKSIFSPDADVVLIGTDAEEERVGPAEIEAQARKDWSHTDAMSISYDWMSISAAGSVAWGAANAAFHLRREGHRRDVLARATFVLQKRGDAWLIAQAHISIAAAD